VAVIAFEGPAGCGKTHRLMDELAALVQATPLEDHQRVLALTFMHGSRRRLDERLRAVPGLGRRFDAMTIDSLALRLVQRWRGLAQNLGHAIPREGDFDATCALAAALLEKPAVQAWMTMSFPIIVVDEAQDLSPARSAMIAAQAGSGTTLLAFDEFQCLDPALLPIAIRGWLDQRCVPTTLAGCWRTNNNDLIAAARAIRDGRAVPLDSGRFKVVATPSVPLAATYMANAIAWRGGGTVAVLTPSRSGGFAERVVARVIQGPIGRHGNGGYQIAWERNDRQEFTDAWDGLGIVDGSSVAEVLHQLGQNRQLPAANIVRERLARRRSVAGIETVSAEETRRYLGRALAACRHHGQARDALFAAMTIQQAKNREFDHVIVVWPYTVPDNPEQRRRLLYNAVTRAKLSCQVFVQADALLRGSPFAAV
jgi:hypothetical protein